MGAAIGQRLMSLGHELAVWNRTAEKTRPLAAAGAKVAATPSQLVASSETIITILTDAAAIDAAYRGKDGLLAGDVAGKLFIEMSTVRPETESTLAAAVRKKSRPTSPARGRSSNRCAGASSTSVPSAPAQA